MPTHNTIFTYTCLAFNGQPRTFLISHEVHTNLHPYSSDSQIQSQLAPAIKSINAERRQAISDDSQRQCVRWHHCRNEDAATGRAAVSILTYSQPDGHQNVFVGSPKVHVWIVPVCRTGCKALVMRGLKEVMLEGGDLGPDGYQAFVEKHRP